MSIDTKKLRQAAASVRAFLKPEFGREIAAAADHIDAQADEIAEAKGQIEHLDRQNNALRKALQAMVDGDAEAIAEAEAAGIPFPEEMLTAYRAAVAALAQHQGEKHVG